MNFQKEYEKGQQGNNKGIPFGAGLENLTAAINGLQRAMIYGIAAGAKVGKSTLADAAFLLGPYLYALQFDLPIVWIYFSFEIDRITKEFDFASYFLYHDHNVDVIQLPEGVTLKGESSISVSSDYLRGRIQDDNNDIIKVSPEIEELLKIVYRTRIIPLFGEYDQEGNQLSIGKIIFIDERDNPTGLRHFMFQYADRNGNFTKATYTSKEGEKKERITGYIPDDPNLLTVCITDHLRKLKPERGYNKKQTVDKWIEYQVELRNWCEFTFVDIIHLNRSMADVNRSKFMGDMLYPTADDIKDTGNLSEEANHVLTMFNPNDDKYNLTTHFGVKIKDLKKEVLYPDMKTVHLVESRHTWFPQHFRYLMKGNVKSFEQLKIK